MLPITVGPVCQPYTGLLSKVKCIFSVGWLIIYCRIDSFNNAAILLEQINHTVHDGSRKTCFSILQNTFDIPTHATVEFPDAPPLNN